MCSHCVGFAAQINKGCVRHLPNAGTVYFSGTLARRSCRTGAISWERRWFHFCQRHNCSETSDEGYKLEKQEDIANASDWSVPFRKLSKNEKSPCLRPVASAMCAKKFTFRKIKVWWKLMSKNRYSTGPFQDKTMWWQQARAKQQMLSTCFQQVVVPD